MSSSVSLILKYWIGVGARPLTSQPCIHKTTRHDNILTVQVNGQVSRAYQQAVVRMHMGGDANGSFSLSTSIPQNCSGWSLCNIHLAVVHSLLYLARRVTFTFPLLACIIFIIRWMQWWRMPCGNAAKDVVLLLFHEYADQTAQGWPAREEREAH